MCGIAGSINFPLDIARLIRDLKHRGPDDQATYTDQNVQLHHQRLAILDITGGKQPMHLEHLTIIFNGEIYNHQDLREKYGFECKTNSDTETILHLYLKLGSEGMDELAGMFAFVIYDKKNNELFMARDRAGKKPLYYYLDSEKFVFASELNTLRHQLPLEIDEENIQQYMQAAYFFKSATPYKKVKELPAASYATVSVDHLDVKVKCWWDIHQDYLQQCNDDFETALKKTDELLHAAVKRRVESSDLEVGSFLSGGIDSGLVTAIAKDYNPALKTFTVSFQGQYDEAPLAKLVADRYQTIHHEIKIGFDHLLRDVEMILSNYGEPMFDSSVIPSYYVSKEAKKHLTVILNGDGGDELFGGYRRYVPFTKYDFFRKSLFIRNMAKLLYPILPLSHDKRSIYNYFYRLVDLSQKEGIHTYFSSSLDVFEGFEKYLTVNDRVLFPLKEDFNRINNSNISGLRKIMNLDFDHILTNLLTKIDIATMANSVEGRSPFFGKELMDYVPTLPDHYKVKGKQTKYILRKLAEKYLPEELISQPKRGFEIPLKKWIDGELREMIAGYLLSPQSYSRNFVKPGFIEQLWDRKIRTGDEKRAKIIWLLFALDVWYKKCYQGK
jgi:asparagine synthase (glutamine-hydrolysing)